MAKGLGPAPCIDPTRHLQHHPPPSDNGPDAQRVQHRRIVLQLVDDEHRFSRGRVGYTANSPVVSHGINPILDMAAPGLLNDASKSFVFEPKRLRVIGVRSHGGASIQGVGSRKAAITCLGVHTPPPLCGGSACTIERYSSGPPSAGRTKGGILETTRRGSATPNRRPPNRFPMCCRGRKAM